MNQERESLTDARTSERVYIPVLVSCGCLLHFGPTLDNGINQPLRQVCKHKHLWSGTFLSETREAIVGRLTTVKVDEVSYAVEPESFSTMYERRFAPGGDCHGSLT